MKIRHQLFLSHGLLVMMALLIIIVNIFVYWNMESDSRIVNHAGKLRSLTYNMVQLTDYHFYAEDEYTREFTSRLLQERMSEFELVMNNLIEKGGLLNTSISQVESVERLNRIRTEWDVIYKPIFNRVISDELHLASLDNLNASIEAYASEIDKMVLMYSIFTREKINRAFLINTALFVMIIIVSVYSYVLTNNRIRRPLQLLMNELKELTLFEEDPTEKLKNLSTNEFKEMTVYFNEMIYDYLTKVYNRRSGLSKLSRMLQHGHRRHMLISLCFIDINGLKSVNDILGHKIGDELIISTVEVIQEEIREGDFIVRMGGDEFLIVFTGIDAEVAESIWNRIMTSFRTINAVEERPYLISASHGIESYDSSNLSGMDAIIKAADMKMYDEKRRMKESEMVDVIKK